MIKIKNIKCMHIAGGMILSFLTASTLFTFSSCADDHFNISQDVTGTKTIWENIQDNKELSDFAYILQHVPYSLKEKGFTSETYADVLNSDQTFTIWAPTNGSYDFEKYKKLIETGTEDNLKLVESQFIRNNMTRYTHIMNGQGTEKLVLFNGKRGILDYANNTFKDQSIIRPNIGSSNGVLHITQAPAEFEPNVYEFIRSYEDAKEYNKFLKIYEQDVFNESASSPGPTVKGKATWVDSVTYRYNAYLGSNVECEDSNFVAIIPTDNAWKSVYDKIASYFRFKDTYVQDIHTKTENGSDTIITGKETIMSDKKDSIQNLYTSDAILRGSIYNANWQPKQVSITSLADLAKVDSLVTYDGYKFKKTGTLNATNHKTETFEVDDYVQMFGGKDPIKCSNGYAYITDAWNFPSSMYAPTLEIDASLYLDSEGQTTTIKKDQSLIVTYDTEKGDSIAKYNYLEMSVGSGSYSANFMLPNVCSCKYDIYVVTLHNNAQNLPTIFKAKVIRHTDSKKTPVEDTRINNNYQDAGAYGEEIKKSSPKFYTHQAKIDTISTSPITIRSTSLTDTICIAKDYEFPYSYYGMGSDAYPMLGITASLSSSDTKTDAKYKYCRTLRLVSIILKPKREE